MFKKVTETRKELKELLAIAPAHYPIRPAEALLLQKQLIPLLKKLPTIINAPEEHYQSLYLATIHHFANFIQGLPAVKTKSFNYHGGFLDLSLERTYLTLASYRKEYPIKDIKPEQMPPKLALWTYALFTLGLFYGIGEIAATYWVSITDEQGHHGQRWNPFQLPMGEYGSHYRYSFEALRRDDLAQKTAPILAKQLMPLEGFLWIANDKEVFEYWLRVLQNIHTDTGIFSQLLLPIHDELSNRDPLALALHQSTVTPYEDSEAKTKSFLENLETTETEISTKEVTPQGLGNETPGSGVSIGAGFTDLDVTGANTIEIGERFINWLKMGIIGQTISVNRSNSRVNISSDGLMMLSPEIFMEFVKANPYLNTTSQDVQKSIINSGYAISSRIKASNYIHQANVARQFNIATSTTANQGKGIAIDPSVVYNTRQMPHTLSNLQSGIASQPTYPNQAIQKISTVRPTSSKS